jgi:hypothetical protein
MVKNKKGCANFERTCHILYNIYYPICPVLFFAQKSIYENAVVRYRCIFEKNSPLQKSLSNL